MSRVCTTSWLTASMRMLKLVMAVTASSRFVSDGGKRMLYSAKASRAKTVSWNWRIGMLDN